MTDWVKCMADIGALGICGLLIWLQYQSHRASRLRDQQADIRLGTVIEQKDKYIERLVSNMTAMVEQQTRAQEQLAGELRRRPCLTQYPPQRETANRPSAVSSGPNREPGGSRVEA